MSSLVSELTDKNFDEVSSQTPWMVIDFWAEWCEPCKDFSRLFHEVAEEHLSEFSFFTVDVDKEKQLAQDFSVKSVPTLAIIRNNVMVFYQSGLMPKQALKALLAQARALPETNF